MDGKTISETRVFKECIRSTSNNTRRQQFTALWLNSSSCHPSSLVGGEAALALALPGPDAGADLLVEVEPLGAHLHRAHAVQARVELVALAGLGRRVDAVLPRAERVPRLGPLQRVTPPALVLRVLDGGGESEEGWGQSLCGLRTWFFGQFGKLYSTSHLT